MANNADGKMVESPEKTALEINKELREELQRINAEIESLEGPGSRRHSLRELSKMKCEEWKKVIDAMNAELPRTQQLFQYHCLGYIFMAQIYETPETIDKTMEASQERNAPEKFLD